MNDFKIKSETKQQLSGIKVTSKNYQINLTFDFESDLVESEIDCKLNSFIDCMEENDIVQLYEMSDELFEETIEVLRELRKVCNKENCK